MKAKPLYRLCKIGERDGDLISDVIHGRDQPFDLGVAAGRHVDRGDRSDHRMYRVGEVGDIV